MNSEMKERKVNGKSILQVSTFYEALLVVEK